MALCSFSSNLAMNGYTVLDNTFFNEFLPSATGDDIKVYLYGLALCSNPNVEDNSLDTIAKVLSLTTERVENAFSYWQEMGLCQIVSTNPFEVRYLPVNRHSGSTKIRSKEKYSDFNKQIQNTITGRMITPNEFNEYYILIETYHFEPEALVLIAKYCTMLKSQSIGYPYILAVARSFANEGIKTLDSVEKKLDEQELSKIEIKQIFEALGIKRESDIDERNLYLKWTNNFGFSQGIILSVAKSLKKKGGLAKLDELLSKYFELKLFSLEEISTFNETQEFLLNISKMVCKNLGIYYQNYDNVIKTFTSVWTNMGFDEPTLEMISNYCFKRGIRQLDGMNQTIQKFYKMGLVSSEAISKYMDNIVKNDELVKEILESAGTIRLVNSSDREFYKTWSESWNFSHEAIKFVAESSKDKAIPMPYMNKILSTLHDQNKHNIDEIKSYLNNNSSKKSSKNVNDFAVHGYSDEQLNAVFDSLEDVEI